MDLVYAVNMLVLPAVVMFFAGLAMLAVEVLAKPRATSGRTDWEQMARETFSERRRDVGRVPDRRQAPIPTWRPDPSNA